MNGEIEHNRFKTGSSQLPLQQVEPALNREDVARLRVPVVAERWTDLHFGREVKKRLGSSEHFALIEEYHHPRLTMAALGCMDFCILERLHAVILTSLTGVPFYVVSYDDKVTEFVKLIGGDERLMELPDFMRQTSFAWLEPHLDGRRPHGE